MAKINISMRLSKELIIFLENICHSTGIKKTKFMEHAILNEMKKYKKVKGQKKIKRLIELKIKNNTCPIQKSIMNESILNDKNFLTIFRDIFLIVQSNGFQNSRKKVLDKIDEAIDLYSNDIEMVDKLKSLRKHVSQNYRKFFDCYRTAKTEKAKRDQHEKFTTLMRFQLDETPPEIDISTEKISD